MASCGAGLCSRCVCVLTARERAAADRCGEAPEADVDGGRGQGPAEQEGAEVPGGRGEGAREDGRQGGAGV